MSKTNKHNVDDLLSGNSGFNPFIQIEEFEAFLKKNKAERHSFPFQMTAMALLVIFGISFLVQKADLHGALKAGQSFLADLNDLTEPPPAIIHSTRPVEACEIPNKTSYLAKASLDKFITISTLERELNALKFEDPNLSLSLEQIRSKLVKLEKDPAFSQESSLWQSPFPTDLARDLRADSCQIDSQAAYGKLFSNAASLSAYTLYGSLLSDLENRQASGNAVLASAKTEKDCQCKCPNCKDLRDCACRCHCN